MIFEERNAEVVSIFDERIKRQTDFDETVKLKLERVQFVENKLEAIKDALDYAEQELWIEKFQKLFRLSNIFSRKSKIRQKIFYVSNNRSEHIWEYSLRVPTADCFFAFAKHHVTVEQDFQKGLKFGYDASQIYEELLGEKNKKTISVKVALAKERI
jgi:hypothetical protein